MARRKKRTTRRAPVSARTRTRTVVKRVKSSSSFKPASAVLGGLTYGFARGKVAQLISPATRMLPVGQYADELGMGVLSWFAAKGKLPLIPVKTQKMLGFAGLSIEGAVVGNDLANGTLAGGFGANKVANGGLVI